MQVHCRNSGGLAFYNVAILEDSPVYGCTCHIMDDGFDTGPIVKVRRFGINPKLETALSLEKKAQTKMILLFREVISEYESKGMIPSTEQNPLEMRYMNAEQFAGLKEIPANASPDKVDRIARAFSYPPYEVAYYRMPNGTKVQVVPEIAKDELAAHLHSSALDDFMRVCGISLPTFAKSF